MTQETLPGGGRVALNAMPLLAPLTGIGQYTLQLASRLHDLLAPPPLFFYGRDWSADVRTPLAGSPSAGGWIARAKQAVPMGWRIARALQQLRFDRGVRGRGIALYHEPNYLAFSFAGPTVVTVHDLSWIRHPETHPAERVESMNATLPRVLREAAHVIADSGFTRAEVIGHFGVAAERITTVPLGVGSDFRPRPAAETQPFLARHGLVHGRYFLAVATLEPRKNLEAVLEAYARLPEAVRRDHPLALAGGAGWGTPESWSAFEARSRALGARLLGYVAPRDLPLLYAGARAFAYPSWYEGFGLPCLEAMASGIPVACSNRASLPELVGDAALQVEPSDHAGLAGILHALVEDAVLHERLARAGPARAAAFTWERCALETLAVYRRVLSR